MVREWSPSVLGRFITGSSKWHLRLAGQDMVLGLDGQEQLIPIEDLPLLEIRKGLFWGKLTLRQGYPDAVRVDGLPNRYVSALQSALQELLVETRVPRFFVYYAGILNWLEDVRRLMTKASAKRWWITDQEQQEVLDRRPLLKITSEGLKTLFETTVVQQALGSEIEKVGTHLNHWETDWRETWRSRNERHTKRELVECSWLFEQVESQPLTEEQARAAICFDNHVLTVASAGSGKTSVMVAKAAYGIYRKYVNPDRVVMLAFNSRAAQELKLRAAKSFKRVGMNVSVEGLTFHKLGLEIIGAATGRKPRVPKWARETVTGLEKLTQIVDSLKDQYEDFRTQWDMFRLVFGRDLPPLGKSGASDALVTLRGDLVSSQEECVLSNWLFYNGVNYEYERPYEHDTVTASHSQYLPDFYYPDIDVYHEHFAFDANGVPPAHFENYLEEAQWKRQLHRERRTVLIETTSHQIRTGGLFKHLTTELTNRGLILDPNPDRPIPGKGASPIKESELLALVGIVIRHAKSNSLTVPEIEKRIQTLPSKQFVYRFQLFLKIVERVMQAWDEALAAEEGIDFEDMINQAAQYLEQGHGCPYSLVMADEYQDASRARARLCRALVAKPNNYFFAVGDDWQSINRFAGADVAAMKNFREWFGGGELLRLQKTFRCPQEICDVSSRFISKNPAQIAKVVGSVTPATGPAFIAVEVEKKNELLGAVSNYLAALHADLVSGKQPSAQKRKVSVFVLGRYNDDVTYVPAGWERLYGDRITLEFMSIHKSKGTEADYVILPAMVRGFPSLRTDDLLLWLVMPDGDTYDHGEERRLMYVALTRARRSVAMFTVKHRHSPFLDELIEDGAVTLTTQVPAAVPGDTCPRCKTGELTDRTGRQGPYRACSDRAGCGYTISPHFTTAVQNQFRR